MSLIKSSKFKAATRPGFQDIDYVLAAQRSAEITSSLEDHQADVLHAVDVVTSLENLNQVMESIQELDVIDAALIEVVGNIAGASSGVHGSHFTPSMEAAEDAGPSMGAKIKEIYDKIIAALRVIISKVKAYIAYIWSASHQLAKSYEKLGENIRQFNFVNAKTISLKDIKGAKGGPKAVLQGVLNLSKATLTLLATAPQILNAQIGYIYEAEEKKSVGESAHLKTIASSSLFASKYCKVVSEGSETENTIMHGGLLINNIYVNAEVFKESSDPTNSIHRAFSARTGFEYSTEESTPLDSSFVITHDLAKNIFEALRPLIDSLVNKNEPSSFISILEGVNKEGEKIDQWLHSKFKDGANYTASTEMQALYKSGLQLMGTAQLASLIRSHKIMESTLLVVISYLNKCLVTPQATAAPKTESTQAA